MNKFHEIIILRKTIIIFLVQVLKKRMKKAVIEIIEGKIMLYMIIGFFMEIKILNIINKYSTYSSHYHSF